jgi:CheY-like chemotaxis protein
MANVLVVDDEREYREELYSALARAGHEVMTRGNGLAAIDLGVRLRPDVLIVDWMLKDSIDGLSVSDVLRTVAPQTKVIVMTGFASRDLREQSSIREVAEFLDKPFSMSDIMTAVQRAVGEPAKTAEAEPPVGCVPLGAVEIDEHWNCVYANPLARSLLGLDQAIVGRGVRTLFRFGSDAMIEGALSRWTDVPLSPTGSERCLIRIREWGDIGTKLMLLLKQQDIRFKNHRLTNLILNQRPKESLYWPYDAHSLVLARNLTQRLTMVESLGEIGCKCHGASDLEEALRLLKRDAKIRLALVDRDCVDDKLAVVRQELLNVRPELTVIGTSTATSRDYFFNEGILYYLQSPWESSDLIGLLKLEKLLAREK